MKEVYVKTQAELDKAIAGKKSDEIIVCTGGGYFMLTDNSSATLTGNSSATLYGNSSATLIGNSSATLTGNSSATLYGNSSARLTGNSSATLYGNSSATLYGNSSAMATKYCAIHELSKSARCNGGVIIKVPTISTAAQWCDFYGVKVKSGIAVLYKALRDDYKSSHGFEYKPGSTPAAPDWDGGNVECGGGLHFSPSPAHALEFDPEATKFMACPVLLKEIKVHKNAAYPQKVKAPRVYKPCYEVDIHGKRIVKQEER